MSSNGVIRRKAPDLPRYVEISSEVGQRLSLNGTTPVEVVLNGTEIGRRNLKPWPRRDCWFMDLTEAHCRDAGVDTGDEVAIRLRRASTELPVELRTLIHEGGSARATWESLTAARRRAIADHVRAAKRPDTRSRRARKALGLD